MKESTEYKEYRIGDTVPKDWKQTEQGINKTPIQSPILVTTTKKLTVIPTSEYSILQKTITSIAFIIMLHSIWFIPLTMQGSWLWLMEFFHTLDTYQIFITLLTFGIVICSSLILIVFGLNTVLDHDEPEGNFKNDWLKATCCLWFHFTPLFFLLHLSLTAVHTTSGYAITLLLILVDLILIGAATMRRLPKD